MQNKNFKKLMIRFFAFVFALAALQILLFESILIDYKSIVYSANFLLLTVITLAVLILLGASEKEEGPKFVRIFLGAIGIKLFTLFTYILIYLLIQKENAKAFLISLLVLYFLFTIFEVVSILFFMKQQKRQKK